MFNVEEWLGYVKAVQETPDAYTAQDRHLAELLLEVFEDRERILKDYLDAAAQVRFLEHRLLEAEAQIAYYRSR